MMDAEEAWQEYPDRRSSLHPTYTAFIAGYRRAQLDDAKLIDELARSVWLTHSKTRAYHIALKHAAALLAAHADGREAPNLPKAPS